MSCPEVYTYTQVGRMTVTVVRDRRLRWVVMVFDRGRLMVEANAFCRWQAQRKARNLGGR